MIGSRKILQSASFDLLSEAVLRKATAGGLACSAPLLKPSDLIHSGQYMPPQLLYDISALDLTQIVYDQEAIRAVNPQRGDMEHLNGIVYSHPAEGRIIGYKDVRPDEFWVPGHIPGRPLLPGVLMIEAGAQLASFYTHMFIGWKGFIGFGGAEDIRFRQPVAPGCRLHIVGQKIWERHRRMCCKVQGVVGGTLVFEATIIGTEL